LKSFKCRPASRKWTSSRTWSARRRETWTGSRSSR